MCEIFGEPNFVSLLADFVDGWPGSPVVEGRVVVVDALWFELMFRISSCSRFKFTCGIPPVDSGFAPFLLAENMSFLP